MALVLHNNVGFVTTAPTEDPAGTNTTIDGSSVVVKDISPPGSVKIIQIGWYRGQGNNAANFEVALYSESGGVANGRLFVDNTNSSTVTGWITVDVDWTISENTLYWLAVQMDAHSGSSSIDSATSEGSGSDILTSQTTLNSPYGGGAVADSDGMYAIYALVITNQSINAGETGVGTDSANEETSLSANETGAGTDAASVEPLVPNPIILEDSFTDSDGILVQNHTPEIGNWSYHPVSGVGGDGQITSNRLTLDTGNVNTVIINNVDSGTDFLIEVPFFMLSFPNSNAGVIFCCNPSTDNHFVFRYNSNTQTFEFRKTVTGAGSPIASKAFSLSASDEKLVVIEKSGTTFNIRIDGILYAEFTNITESTFSSGRIGFRFTGLNTPTTGVAFSSIKATNSTFINAGETGVGTDSASVQPLVDVSEIGVGSEATNVEASTSSSETGAGAELISVVSEITSSEIGIGTDSSEISASISADEILPGIDSASVQETGTNISVGEIGVGTESTSIEASVSSSETSPPDGLGTVEANTITDEFAPGTDFAEAIGQPVASENSPGIESVFVERFAFANELSPGIESTSISVSFGVGESGIGIDSASAVEIGSEKEVSEGSIPDGIATIEGQIPISETFNGAETITIQSSLSVSEAGILSDISSVEGLITATEGLSSTEVVQTSADISVGELGAGTDFANIQIPGSALALEGVPGTDSAFITAQIISSEIGVGIDSAQGIPNIVISENAPGIDASIISSTTMVLESAPGIDSMSIGGHIFADEGMPGIDLADMLGLILTGEFGVGSDFISIGGNIFADQLGAGTDFARSNVFGTLTISGKVKMAVLENGRTFSSVSKANTIATILNNGKTSCEVTNG